jgi:hypothetical protein
VHAAVHASSRGVEGSSSSGTAPLAFDAELIRRYELLRRHPLHLFPRFVLCVFESLSDSQPSSQPRLLSRLELDASTLQSLSTGTNTNTGKARNELPSAVGRFSSSSDSSTLSSCSLSGVTVQDVVWLGGGRTVLALIELSGSQVSFSNTGLLLLFDAARGELLQSMCSAGCFMPSLRADARILVLLQRDGSLKYIHVSSDGRQLRALPPRVQGHGSRMAGNWTAPSVQFARDRSAAESAGSSGRYDEASTDEWLMLSSSQDGEIRTWTCHDIDECEEAESKPEGSLQQGALGATSCASRGEQRQVRRDRIQSVWCLSPRAVHIVPTAGV